MASEKQTNRKLSLWGIIILGVLVVLAAGLILYLKTSKTPTNLPASNDINSSAPATTPKPLTLFVEGVTVVNRGSALNEFKNDEIKATIRGRFELKNEKPEELGLLAFWRLPSNSTNWYLATTSANGKVQPAILDGATAVTGNWSFEIGGIKVDKSYQGPVILVLMAYKRDLIAANQQAWLSKTKGDGFVEIPELRAKVDSSAPATFFTGNPGAK